ncbi:MAG: AAA family ATPase [Firmicutes bacterium]|nr:AAA family ATPase [Bacillota bacterium]
MEKIIDYLKKEYDKLDTSIFELSDALMGAAGRSRDTASELGKIDAAAGDMSKTLNDTLAETMELIDKMTKSGLGSFEGLGDFAGGAAAPSLVDMMDAAGKTADVKNEDMKTAEVKEEAKAEETKTANAEANAEQEPEPTLEELLAEMDELVGLEAVKKDIRTMMNFIRVCKLRTERGMKAPDLSYHMVFSGNPGTGKTTIARMLAQLYKAIGVLKEGQLVEVDRSGLIAGYQGQTAIKTQEVIQSAIGGVLFIDEAYALVESDNDTYGKECIATILKAMEDHRDELIVIVAGYDDLMEKFIDSNPGLKSRFNKYIHFPDYTGEEMMDIFRIRCKSNGYETEAEAEELLLAVFNDMYDTRDENFGNGRTVRNIFEKIINCQATRLAADMDITDEELRLLTVADVKEGLEMTPEEEEA